MTSLPEKPPSILRGAAWLSTMTVAAQAIGVLCMPVLARLYRPEDFGAANIFALSVGLICVVSSWRFEHLVFTAESDDEARAMVQVCMLLGGLSVVIFTPVFFVYRDWLSGALNVRNEFMVLLLVPLASSLYSLSTAMQHYLQRKERIKVSGASEIANKGTYCLCGIAFSGWSNGGAALALATTGGYASKVAFLVLAGWRPVPMAAGLRLMTAVWRKHGRIASSLVLSFLLYAVNNAAPAMFVASRYGSDVLGQFSLAVTVTALFEVVAGNAIGKMYYQRAAALDRGGEALIGLWCQTVWTLVRIGIPVFLTMALLSPWGFPFLFGAQWHLAGELAPALCLSAGASFCTAPVGWTFAVVGNQWYGPVWHASRVISLFVVFAAVSSRGDSVQTFVWAFAAQSVMMFGVDLCAQWRFAAGRSPSLPAPTIFR